MFEWAKDHAAVLLWVTILSGVLLVVSMGVAAFVLVRVDASYFTPASQLKRRHAKRNLALAIVKNIVGWALVVVGFVMLFGPGQGMIIILIGVMVADFPGKERLERWIVTRKAMLRSINRLRKHYHRDPLRTADPAPPGTGPAGATYAVMR